MREYVKPMMDSEVFMANEFCSTCTTQEVYKFECNARGGVMGYVFEETNGQPGLQVIGNIFTGTPADTNLTSFLGGYHACGATHYVSVDNADFVSGYYITSKDGVDATPVTIWKGENGDNVHCTEALHPETWETVRS